MRRILGLAGLLALATACFATHVRSLPDDTAGPGRGYHVGMALQLREDRLLVHQDACRSCPPQLQRQYSEWRQKWYQLHGELVRGTIEEYQRDPGAFPLAIGLVPAGTRLEVTRIEHGFWLWLDWYDVFARTTTGPLAGREVDLGRITATSGTQFVDTGAFEIIE